MGFEPSDYWNKRLSKSFGLHGVGYLGFGEAYNAWMYRLRRHVFTRHVNSLNLPNNARILDIGSGTGFYLETWQSLGFHEITGCDMSSVAVERLANSYPNVDVFELDVGAPELGEDHGQYDVISCMDVLFHIVDESRFDNALRNISKLLAPDGVLLYSDNFMRAEPVTAEHHVSRTLARIVNTLTENDLRVVSRAPMFILMNQPIDARRKRLAKLWWKLVQRANRTEASGYLTGATLYAADRLLVALLDESPTTEMMVCTKVS